MDDKTSNLVYSAFFVALMTVFSFIAIPVPFSPSPITLSPLAVMLGGCLLKPKQAFSCMMTYLLMGAIGLPVFAGMVGGVGILMGPRGGYYMGFLVGIIFLSVFRNKFDTFAKLIAGNIFGGVFIVYFFGVTWLAYILNITLKEALFVGAVPFLLGDMLKVFLASWLVIKLRKHMQ